jgi:hypothetical protein
MCTCVRTQLKISGLFGAGDVYTNDLVSDLGHFIFCFIEVLFIRSCNVMFLQEICNDGSCILLLKVGSSLRLEAGFSH